MASPDTPEKITYFAETDYRSQRVKFGIRDDDRAKHMYVIGKTGMGKSTLLENLAVQDIQNGEGICFIDPHGGTAETLLSYVPEHRIKDVIYFAPFDQEYPVALNVMEDMGRDKRALIVSGLIGAFKKVWVDAWSPRMEYLLSNALLALLETPGSTLLGVNRMFADKAYRNTILAKVEDPSVRSFWFDEFAKYSDKFATEATAAIQNKIGQFAGNPLIRNMVGQPKSTFDIRKVMDERKILIVNLSKGRMGEGNANLVGSMFITKIYLAAMSRADVGVDVVKGLPPFYLYVDEFQSFANESFADILSEARKYKLSLTIAHQYIEQMSDEVRAAVFGNVGSMVAFRVGAYDADVLEKEFAPAFTAEDMVNLGFAQIYLKLMIHGVGSAPFSATTLPPVKKPAIDRTQEVIASSRSLFARPRAEVEAEIMKWHEPIQEGPRDPNATAVPETRKYAPGMRPQREGDGARPRVMNPATARSEKAADPDALRQALRQAMIERSPSNPLPPKKTTPIKPVTKPVEFRAAPLAITPLTPTALSTPKPALSIPRAPYAPMAIHPGEHKAKTVESPIPPVRRETSVAVEPQPTRPRLPAEQPRPTMQEGRDTLRPAAGATHKPFAIELAKLSTPQQSGQQGGASAGGKNGERPVRTDERKDDRREGDRRNEERQQPHDRSAPIATRDTVRNMERESTGRETRTEVPPGASLALLKSNAKKDKGPSEQNLSSLRDVLRQVATPKPESSGVDDRRDAPRPVDRPQPKPVERPPERQELLPSVEETVTAAQEERTHAAPQSHTAAPRSDVRTSAPAGPPVFAPKQPIRPMEIPEDVLKSVLED